MTRIRFEDLPSTNTPRNAENLNKLNNVVISSTEPTTGEEVWIDNINKKIYTKNDNGVYEEFYKDNEIVESGSNANGNWVKYADGRMECYIEKTVAFNFSSNQKWGVVWESDETDLGDFPSNFIEKPQISVDNMSGSGGFIECLQETTYSHIGKLWICRPVETEGSVAYTLSIIAKGRWK